MSIIALFAIWTWGLTPVWVNVISTVILGLRILFNVIAAIAETVEGN